MSFYANDTRVLCGLVIAQLGICLVFPLIGLIGYRMLRIEGGRHPILTFIQLVTGAATGVLLLLPMLLMAVIAFRPDRNPELTVTLNDISWLLFITPIAPFIIQNIAIGTAILRDRRATLPRWVGYMNFWIAASFIPRPAGLLLPQRAVLVARCVHLLAGADHLCRFPRRYGPGPAGGGLEGRRPGGIAE